MLEFLFEPLVDTYFFGCPDSCIVPNGEIHQWLKLLFMPITLLTVSAGTTFGLLLVTRRLPRFSLPNFSLKRKDPIQKLLEKSIGKEPKSIKDLEHAIKKEKKQEFLDLKIEPNEDPFTKFVEMQSPDHPVSANLDTVRTEAKEQIITPEQKLLDSIAEKEKKEIEEQAKRVKELMDNDGLTEDEAVDKVISESEIKEEIASKERDLTVITDPKEYQETVDEIDSMIDDLEDRDIFKQDKPKPRFKSKTLAKLQKHFAKKEKPTFKWKLNDLGIKRRDQYAEQIELKLGKWALPLPKYEGKNQEFQKTKDQVEQDLKKLALFLSTGELMKDREKKKRMYWDRKQIATE